MAQAAAEATLKAPTAEQNAAYRECLQFDRLAFEERLAGRSGLLTDAQRAQHGAAWSVVADALEAGVGFDRMAFDGASLAKQEG
jgi:hypothetical protein